MRSFSHPILILLAGTLVLLPLAQASHTVSNSSSSGSACTFSACTVNVSHSIYSAPSTHCIGSPGAYTACNVTHSCTVTVTGLATTGSLNCSGVGGGVCTTGTSTSCSTSRSGNVLIATGSCVVFAASGTATALTGSAAAAAPGFTVCVDLNGPFQA